MDREITGHDILPIRRKAKIEDNAKVYAIGTPSGLPVKITIGAKVFDNSHEFYFNTNLDTYGGNSGSPVFDNKTHMVEGILVRGGEDFEYVLDKGCWKTVYVGNTDTDENGRREDVTRCTVFSDLIPLSITN